MSKILMAATTVWQTATYLRGCKVRRQGQAFGSYTKISLAGACIVPDSRVEHGCFPSRQPRNRTFPTARADYSQHTHSEGQGGMWDKLMSVMDNWYFIGGCILALAVLVGLYLFLKNKNKDEA